MGDFLTAKLLGIAIVGKFQYMPLNLLAIAGKKIFNVVPVDTLPAIKTKGLTERLQSSQTPPPHLESPTQI